MLYLSSLITVCTIRKHLKIINLLTNNYRKLEILYGITRPIVLLYMIGDALGLITMPYLIVMVRIM